MTAYRNRSGNGYDWVELLHDGKLVASCQGGGINPGHFGLVGEMIAQAANMLEAGPSLTVKFDGQVILPILPILSQSFEYHRLFAYPDSLAKGFHAPSFH
jgi:hypothetical protein